MSSSDAASADNSDNAISNISPDNLATPLHRSPLVPDSALLSSLSKHNPPAPEDELLQNSPFVYAEDDNTPIAVTEDDSDDEDDTPEVATERLSQIYRTRNKEPPPGAIRVHKIVRVRKLQSSSKRRTKKHALRVQLKEKDRIEEEMAQFRGKGRGRTKEQSIPERRYYSVDAGSRGPSSLRYSQSCNYEDDLEDKGPSKFPENPEMSAECRQAPPPPLDPDAQADQNTKT